MQRLRLASFAVAASISLDALVATPAAAEPRLTLLPQEPLDRGFGDASSLFERYPEIGGAVGKLTSDPLLPDSLCGVRFDDGQTWLLVSAKTPESSGMLPYGIAYDARRKLAMAVRAQTDRGREAVFGAPDPGLRAVMLAVAANGCFGLTRSANVDVAGAPSAFDCMLATARPPSPNPQTQLDLNTQARDQAVKAECGVRSAYESELAGLVAVPTGGAKLDASQRAWKAYRDARQAERYPHEDEQGYYGSIHSMCISGFEQGEDTARTRELSSTTCAAGASTEASAKADAAGAEHELDSVLVKVLAKGTGDAKFVAAMQRTQDIWRAFRDAQAALVAATSLKHVPDACAAKSVAATTRARTAVLREWLKKHEEGDSCAGSLN